MKTQNNILKELNQNALNALTTEVKETLATEVVTNQEMHSFKAIDFWNIQRLQKSRGCSRMPSISVR